jgi:tubulin polyglutamylase TTLL11
MNMGFAPSFWILPRDLELFKAQSSEKFTYIAKPDMGSQGEGIFLLRGAGKAKKNAERLEKEFAFGNGRTYVVQNYVNCPLLIENKKWDLR